MSEILETYVEKQASSVYRNRYMVTIVTGLYYYELIYRFPQDSDPHLTVTRLTYGKVHETRSGFTRVLENEAAVTEHARKTVKSMENRLLGDFYGNS